MDPQVARGFLAGVSLVVVASLAAFALLRPQTPKAGPALGGAPASSPGPAAPGPAGDVEKRLEAAQAALDRQDYMTAWTETEAVLKREPGHPAAMTYQALVRVEMGQADVALRMLDEARAKAPDSIAVYAYSAMAYVRLRRTKEAEALIADAKRRFPDQAKMLDEDFARMKDLASRAPLPDHKEGQDPHAGVAPVGSGVPVPDADDLADEVRTVSGRLEMDPALRAQLPARVVMFVTLREAGESKGPVLATKKIETTGFPVFFEVGPQDSPRGERLPTRVLVEGRVDADGDPSTRSPSDPTGRLDEVSLGRFDLHLDLRRP